MSFSCYVLLSSHVKQEACLCGRNNKPNKADALHTFSTNELKSFTYWNSSHLWTVFFYLPSSHESPIIETKKHAKSYLTTKQHFTHQPLRGGVASLLIAQTTRFWMVKHAFCCWLVSLFWKASSEVMFIVKNAQISHYICSWSWYAFLQPIQLNLFINWIIYWLINPLTEQLLFSVCCNDVVHTFMWRVMCICDVEGLWLYAKVNQIQCNRLMIKGMKNL